MKVGVLKIIIIIASIIKSSKEIRKKGVMEGRKKQTKKGSKEGKKKKGRIEEGKEECQGRKSR